MRRYKNHFGSLVLALLTHLAAAVTVLVLGFLVSYVLVRGVPNLRPEMFALTYTSENQSMLPAIINTCTMTLFSLLVAVPFGVGSAIYLVEYAKKGSKIVSLVRVTTETLSGIPSIVYGLFGMLFFSGKLHFGYSMLSGALTLSIMILPLIMRTTEEALLSVPDMYREGSFGLGAGRLRTMVQVILPLVLPGLVAVAIYTFLNAWDDYLMALTVVRIDEKRTLTVGLAQSFMGEYSNDYGALMAFSVAGSLPIVLLFIFFQKYMVEGLTAGAVKG